MKRSRAQALALRSAPFALLLAASAHWAWNASALEPLCCGYDAPGHAGYVYTVAVEHRLPDPLEGWSTFHPPLYYLADAVVWKATSWLGALQDPN